MKVLRKSKIHDKFQKIEKFKQAEIGIIPEYSKKNKK